jgi:hypothetical protein
MTTPQEVSAIKAPPADRARWWLMATLVIQYLTILFNPMFFCGCHFHPERIPAGLLPIVWGFYALFSHRTLGERVIGYVSGALSAYWRYDARNVNIQFAFQ